MRRNRPRYVMGEEHLATNIRHERGIRGWSAAELAERMYQVGCPIDQSAIHKIEKQGRRITVDELVGLSRVLSLPLDRLVSDPVLGVRDEVMSALTSWFRVADIQQQHLSDTMKQLRDLEQRLAELVRISDQARDAVDEYLAAYVNTDEAKRLWEVLRWQLDDRPPIKSRKRASS